MRLDKEEKLKRRREYVKDKRDAEIAFAAYPFLTHQTHSSAINIFKCYDSADSTVNTI